jgi:hypothetical protein
MTLSLKDANTRFALRDTLICSVDGCTRAYSARGLCSLHYDRMRRRGTTDPLPSLSERLWSRVVQQPNGCREWQGALSDGYGVISDRGKQLGTHRVAWKLTNGPIPDGLHVLHHCDNPPCCQTEPTEGYPEGHLFLGTPLDNTQDMSAKGRNHFRAQTHCPQNHAYSPENTYVTSQGFRQCKACRRSNDRAYYARNAARKAS